MKAMDDLPGSRRGDLNYVYGLLQRGQGLALVGQDTVDDLLRMARRDRLEGVAKQLDAWRGT